MIDIGPNLLAAILALVSLGTAAIAAWRAERAISRVGDQAAKVAQNSDRIATLENHAAQ